MWHLHFLSQQTLGLAPSSAAPWLQQKYIAFFSNDTQYTYIICYQIWTFLPAMRLWIGSQVPLINTIVNKRLEYLIWDYLCMECLSILCFHPTQKAKASLWQNYYVFIYFDAFSDYIFFLIYLYVTPEKGLAFRKRQIALLHIGWNYRMVHWI